MCKATAETGHKHPNRYPKHKGPKGQVLGGECNTTRCENHRAHWYNQATYGFYCSRCAHGLNERRVVPICIAVDAKPDREEMDRLHKALMQAELG